MTAELRRVALGAVAAATVAALVSVMSAAVGDGGVVTTCFNKAKAIWRPIDTTAGETCKSGEQMVTLYTKGGADALKAGDADKLDGLDSTAFLGATATAVNSHALGGLPPTAFLGAGGQAADSAKFNGMLPSAFLLAGGTAADSAKLGGTLASAFLTQTAADTRYLGIGAQAADSAKLGGTLASAFLTQTAADTSYLGIGAQAADSKKLDGKDPDDYLLKAGTATNSDKLDNIDSTGFVQGKGSYERYGRLLSSGGADDVRDVGPFGQLTLKCGANNTAAWTFQRNLSSNGADAALVQQGSTGAFSAVSLPLVVEIGGTAPSTPLYAGAERWTLTVADLNTLSSAEIVISALSAYPVSSSFCRFFVVIQG